MKYTIRYRPSRFCMYVYIYLCVQSSSSIDFFSHICINIFLVGLTRRPAPPAQRQLVYSVPQLPAPTPPDRFYDFNELNGVMRSRHSFYFTSRSRLGPASVPPLGLLLLSHQFYGTFAVRPPVPPRSRLGPATHAGTLNHRPSPIYYCVKQVQQLLTDH